SVKDFGAFVEILPGRDGLCHISELSSGYVGSVYDICQVGDEMQVKVIDIDDGDRVKLSRRRALHAVRLGLLARLQNQPRPRLQILRPLRLQILLRIPRLPQLRARRIHQPRRVLPKRDGGTT
ncbi:MAG: S1 RNA-binding domain-containing protein, partial [Planctomycetota bacterium]